MRYRWFGLLGRKTSVSFGAGCSLASMIATLPAAAARLSAEPHCSLFTTSEKDVGLISTLGLILVIEHYGWEPMYTIAWFSHSPKPLFVFM